MLQISEAFVLYVIYVTAEINQKVEGKKLFKVTNSISLSKSVGFFVFVLLILISYFK